MLTREQAKERLKEFEVSNWARRKRKSISRLPNHLQRVFTYELNIFLGLASYSEKKKLAQDYLRGYQWLESTSKRSRRNVFRSLFPKIADYVDLGWDLFANLPYQFGPHRKAFRCPQNPSVTQSARMQWILSLYRATHKYEPTIEWLAEWAAYLPWGVDRALGPLFAAAINKGDENGEKVFQTLKETASGEHPIAAMGSHVVRALLMASREEGWEFIERLLLAAQRQEGLRQMILESVDESHPEAFIRMLQLILDENLVRFSSVFRAANVWFGLNLQADDKKQLINIIQNVLEFLTAEQAATALPVDEEPFANYLRLWAIAFRDAEKAVQPAAELIKSSETDQRFVGVHLLSQLNLTSAHDLLLEKFNDPDLGVATRALHAFNDRNVGGNYSKKDLFERIERVIENFPKKKRNLKPPVFPWMTLPSQQTTAARILLYSQGRRSPKRLVPYISMMDPYDRANVAGLLAKKGKWDRDKQSLFIELLSDRSATVREKAIAEISKRNLTPTDIITIQSLLTRKSGDLRRGMITILLKQNDKNALISAERLITTGDQNQRLAGLEILRLMSEDNRKSSKCRKLTQQYTSKGLELSSDEQILVGQIEDESKQELTLENGLGLIDPAQRTKPVPPRPIKSIKSLSGRKTFISDNAKRSLLSLDDFIHQHRSEEVVMDYSTGIREELVGNLRWLHYYHRGMLSRTDPDQFPLRDLLNTWWSSDGAKWIGKDNWLLLEMFVLLSSTTWSHILNRSHTLGWRETVQKKLFGKALKPNLKYTGVLQGCLEWLINTHPPLGAADLLIDGFEATLTLIPKSELKRDLIQTTHRSADWRRDQSLLAWLKVCQEHRFMFPDDWQADHHVRLWGLLRWMDEPGTGVTRHRPTLDDLFPAFLAGGATEADVIDHLIGSRTFVQYSFRNFHEFSLLTSRKSPQLAAQNQEFMAIVDKCRQRICEVELGRGDMPTASSNLAISLRWSGGSDIFIKTLKALGKTKLARGWLYSSKNKASVLSKILKVSFPGPEDTNESLHNKLTESGISQTALIQAAVYAPQWAQHIEHWLEWDDFAEAVWWIHAHTKDLRWSVEKDIREAWIADINSRTPLTAEDLMEGAVDVDWFNQVYTTLRAERWDALYKAAVYASSGSGHTRAKQFADAMLGNINKDDLTNRITKKRHQDSVRTLGLLPLPEKKNVDEEILERYQVLQEFLRTSKKFGSQRQTSEKLAVRIAMENLARTAGYPDPARLQWAMEADEIKDLAIGPLIRMIDDVELSLSINSIGEPDFSVSRGEKTLKAVPAKLRKNLEVKEIQERKTAIKRQASRMRYTLEDAMCRGDKFNKDEFQELMKHPILKPMISQLVFISEEDSGYLIKNGGSLEGWDGNQITIKKKTAYRLAHPIDLLGTGQWHSWQRECFLKERIQPFKQIFRELYVLTPQEKTDGDRSRRYTGHQVNPRQALALLGKRGWVTKPDVGIQRTFHDEKLTAHLNTQGGYLTPQEVEGITIDMITFAKRGEWTLIPLAEIPPRVFSETMRDIDLIVSVAHMGGVDPEASASTVEMRSSILQETCDMLNIGNVKVKGSHVLISGDLGEYSVHLGSAVVHKQPGGAVCIVPVHAQHRGRIFLPFVDDDPRTAEVISKVLLLAYDKEIKDPIILEQLLR